MSKEPEKSEISRRAFLKTGVGTTAAGFAALSGFAEIVPPRVLGANDRVRVAVIGLHGRGRDHIRELSGLAKSKNVEIAALCDAYEPLIGERQAQIEKMGQPRPKGYQDLRKLFEDKSIDAVTIATPNHWHALMTIWACQAGKDVYVEKPAAHNLFEGQQMVHAAEKYNRMVQHGTQIRSAVAIRNAMDKLHNGLIGDVYLARGLCFKWRDTIGHAPPSAIPQGLDYNLWQGPAPEHVFTKNRFLYNWHWFWWYGNGDIGNQGPHQWDIARWGLGQDLHPRVISSSGGLYGERSAQETPNTQSAEMVYPDGRMIEFEVRGLMTNAEDGVQIGNLFYGTKGWLRLDGDEWQSYLGHKNEEGPGSKTVKDGDVPDPLAEAIEGGHYANFIRAVSLNKPEILTCPIEVGYLSSALPPLANISYRLDRRLTFDPGEEKFVGDMQADRMLTREYRSPYVLPKIA